MTSSGWKNYEHGSKIAKENAIQLRNISTTLSKYDPSKPMALFCQYTAVEEMTKAILLLLTHREFLNKGMANLILSDHNVKSFLFQEIYRGNSRLEHNKMIIGGEKLTQENLKLLMKKHKSRHKQRFDLRNKWIYVDRDEKSKKWTSPKDFIKNFKDIKSRLVVELQALVAFYDILTKMSFDTQVDNFKITTDLDQDGFLKTMSFMYDEI